MLDVPTTDSTLDTYTEVVHRALHAAEVMYPGGRYYAASGDVKTVPVLVELDDDILVVRFRRS
jgi:hypothetical protein